MGKVDENPNEVTFELPIILLEDALV